MGSTISMNPSSRGSHPSRPQTSSETPSLLQASVCGPGRARRESSPPATTGRRFMGGIWEPPSGKVDPGEALDETLIREVKEETGLDVAGIRKYLGEFDYRSGSDKKCRQFNFTVDVVCDSPRTVEV
ncbi:NUDIX hydrolase [Nocardia sp. NPDC046473]|uniref:NUDIX hydrolase n=1 Tax=Nocardia sp. NPDC046473 TaxID=3155733 RepID=UPI0034056661